MRNVVEGAGARLLVEQLGAEHLPAVSALWQAATDERRRALGLEHIAAAGAALDRPDAFGVGVFGGSHLLAMAVAMPALADDGRSLRVVPGLAHISTVATLPGHWGHGLGGRVVRAICSQARRRGYARAQLWTHELNPGARRLYEREGFVLSGRARSDDNGEAIVHYVTELAAQFTLRPAARLIVVDGDQRLLLMHWRDPVDGLRLWEPPGGGIEAGESPYDAVCREWSEETGLDVPDLRAGPTLVARDAFYNGGRLVGDEYFFLGTATSRAAAEPRGFTAVEQETYLGRDWVHWSELDSLSDPVWPDLIPPLQRLDPTGPWRDAPVGPAAGGHWDQPRQPAPTVTRCFPR